VKAIKQKVQGVLQDGEPGVLVLDEAADSVYLVYAFVTLETEQHILPAFLLDDWGNEIKGLDLYEWVEENGIYFPRAEIFGFSPTGQEIQIYLRELDLMARYPCYAYLEAGSPIASGHLLESIYLPDEASSGEWVSFNRPAGRPYPQGKAAVRWFKATT
jgi:hypothetical protein